VVVDSRQRRSRFGRYAAEILRTEGIGSVHVLELASLTLPDLQACGVVVLASCGATTGLLELLGQYLDAGGRLVLLRPAHELAPLLGLEPHYQARATARLLIDSHSSAFSGFPYEALQIAGALDLYRTTEDATIAARTVSTPWEIQPLPAIIERQVGTGRLIAFLYDLPETVARLRQGDPALAEVDADGLEGVRPHDAQQWQIDPTMAHVPQAEVHQALLARAVETLAPWPLPRLWHLPGAAHSLLVLTGDLCSNRPDQWLLDEGALAERHGGTLTLYLHVGTELEANTISRLRQGGHTLSIHPFAVPFSVPAMDETLGRHLSIFAGRFGPPAPRTVRHHRLQWLGWAEQAKLERHHGLLMDLNFTTARPVRNGYLFGAGRPLRFVDEDGMVLETWQQPTQFEDDLILGDHEISLRVGTAEACTLYDALLDDSLARWHSVIAVNLHPGNYARYSGDWGRHLVSTTALKGVPILSAERWLNFTLTRAATRIGVPTGHKTGWRFDVTSASPSLTLLVPEQFQDRTLGDSVSGSTIDHYGRRYRLVPLHGTDAIDTVYGS